MSRNTMSFGVGAGMAIAAGVAALSSYLTSKRNTDKTNKANKQMAEYQYSKDLEMWNKQNEYNSPQNQMQRLDQANLNPNLVYGGGNVTGNSSGQMPKYQAPSMNYNYADPVAPAAQILGQFQDFRIKQSQKDNLEAQRKAIEENVHKTRLDNMFKGETMGQRIWGEESKAQNLDWTRRYWEFRKSRDEQMFPYQLSMIQGKNRALDTSTNKMMAEMEKIKTSTEYEKLKMDWYETQMMGNLGSAGFRALNTAKGWISKKAAGQTWKQVPGQRINQAAQRRFEETTRRMREFGQ